MSESVVSTEAEIDLNSLFNLTYNFDLLKSVIGNIKNKVKINQNNIDQLNDKCFSNETAISNLKEKLVSNLTSQIRTLTENIEDKNKELESNIMSMVEEKIKTNDNNLTNKNKKINEILSNNFKYNTDNINNNTNNNIDDIFNKVNYLEEQDIINKKLLEDLTKNINDKKQLEDSLIKRITLLEKEDLLNKENIEFSMNKIKMFESKISDLRIKFEEINIFESLKQASIGKDSNNTDINSYMILLESMKKSNNMKFELIDTKLNEINDYSTKLKLDLNLLSKRYEDASNNTLNNASKLEEVIKAINNNINDLNDIKTKHINSTISESKKNQPKINSTDINSFKQLKEDFESYVNKLNILESKVDYIDNNNSNLYNATSSKSNNNTENNIDENSANNSSINQIKQRISGLDKNLKIFIMKDKEKEESYNKQLNILNDIIKKKASNDDVKKISDTINKLDYSIDYLKERFDNFDENAVLSDLSWLKKRLDSISNNINDIKSSSMNNVNQSKKKNSNKEANFNINDHMYDILSEKYVEIKDFNDYKQFLDKKFNTHKEELESLKTLINNLNLELKSAASQKDLKLLEDMLLSKLDELRVAFVRKFADKQDTSKSLKYIEILIKQISETNLKKTDKADNWLLAKKPFGGNSCASCEAFIGELTDNREYIPWNKLKDSAEKMYRLGNGFSKMIQMVSLDDNRSKSPINHRYNKKEDINVGMSNNVRLNTENTSFNFELIKNNNITTDTNSSLPTIKNKLKFVNNYSNNHSEFLNKLDKKNLNSTTIINKSNNNNSGLNDNNKLNIKAKKINNNELNNTTVISISLDTDKNLDKKIIDNNNDYIESKM